MKVPSAAEALSILVRPSTKWHAKADICQIYEQNPPFFFKKADFFVLLLRKTGCSIVYRVKDKRQDD